MEAHGNTDGHAGGGVIRSGDSSVTGVATPPPMVVPTSPDEPARCSATLDLPRLFDPWLRPSGPAAAVSDDISLRRTADRTSYPKETVLLDSRGFLVMDVSWIFSIRCSQNFPPLSRLPSLCTGGYNRSLMRRRSTTASRPSTLWSRSWRVRCGTMSAAGEGASRGTPGDVAGAGTRAGPAVDPRER